MEFFVILGGYDKGFYGNEITPKLECLKDLFEDIQFESFHVNLSDNEVDIIWEERNHESLFEQMPDNDKQHNALGAEYSELYDNESFPSVIWVSRDQYNEIENQLLPWFLH